MSQAVETNEYFSFSRWSRLVALHWEGNKKKYLLAIPAIAGLILTWEVFLLFMDAYDPLDDGMQAFTYYWGLGVLGCFYASTIFAEFGNQAQGIAWLSVPASALEKMLCGFLFSAILCFVVYTFSFYLADIPMVEIGNGIIVRHHRVWAGGYPIEPNAVWGFWNGLPGDGPDQQYHIVLAAYFMLQGAFALGSVYFKRLSFLKTLIAVLIFILAFTVIEKQLLENALSKGWHRLPLIGDWLKDNDSLLVQRVRVSSWITGPVGLLILFGVPPIFWVITYFRIKEKEV